MTKESTTMGEQQPSREKFASRIGFILISAGCAIGLGNVWRFPYITGKYGGAALLGKSLLACHNPHSVEAIRKVVEWFAADASHNIVYTYHNAKHDRDVYMVALRDEDGTLIGYYEKHDSRKAETMKQYDLF